VEALADALQANTTLTFLRCALFICTLQAHRSSASQSSLSRTAITDTAVAALAKAFKRNHTLKTLEYEIGREPLSCSLCQPLLASVTSLRDTHITPQGQATLALALGRAEMHGLL
jgi:hypothetical protein